MSKDGVMTTEEFAIQESARVKEQKKAEKKSVKPAPIKNSDVYRFVPMGDGTGNAAFYYNGEKYKLPMVKGCFKIPKDWNEVKKQQYRKMLPEVGFVYEPAQITPEMEKAKKIRFTVMHPDHSDLEPMNGPFEVKIGKKKKKVSIKNGVVITYDERVKNALLKAGFVDETPTEGREPEKKE